MTGTEPPRVTPKISTRARSPIACVLLPDLPIVAHHPNAEDDPAELAVHHGRGTAARIRWVHEHARSHGVRPGHTLAAAQVRCATLQSVLLDTTLLAEAQRLVVATLVRWSPRVAPGGVGRFWCEPFGDDWRARVEESLSGWGPVQIGFGPWAAVAYAAARGASSFDDAPLELLELDPQAIEGLHSLGSRTVGGLLALNPIDIGVRFGPEVAAARRRAGGDDPRGPRAAPEDTTTSVSVDLDDTELDDLEPLLFVLRPALERLLREPRGRGLGITALRLALHARETDKGRLTTIRCARPVADGRLLLELVRADLERSALVGSVIGFTLTAETLAPLTDRNGVLFAEPTRDPAAREIALTRLTSRFGPEVVRRATRVERASPHERAAWTDTKPCRGLAIPWRRQHPAATLEGAWITLAGRRRRVVRLGRVERTLAPFWTTGAMRIERLAWAEVDGPLLVMLRARASIWEAIAWMD